MQVHACMCVNDEKHASVGFCKHLGLLRDEVP